MNTQLTIKQLAYNEVLNINPRVDLYQGFHTVDLAEAEPSVGQIQMAEINKKILIPMLENGTLAKKIIMSNTMYFSEKQIWVIVFELLKNPEFVQMMENKIVTIINKRAAAEEKKAEIKDANASIKSELKAKGKLIKDYKNFLKSNENKNFKKEFYAEKYTQESLAAFLAA